MTDKILCPWCGAEMRTITVPLEKNGKTKKWNAWMACKNIFACQAEGPFVQASTLEEAMDSAKAAALRRYTPPLKPMTLEEATNTEEAVWYEYNGSTRTEKIDCVALPEAKAYTEICTLRRKSAWLVTTECYGKTWRCWERKPTDEERSAAKWEK